MNKLCGLILALLFPAICVGQITSVTGGNFDHGVVLTVNGSGFGSKPSNGTGGSGPIEWTDMEGGTNGAKWSSVETEWVDYVTAWSDGRLYSSTDAHSGNLSTISTQALARRNYIMIPPTDEVFVSYWTHWDNIAAYPSDYGVYKGLRISSTPAAGGGGVYNGVGVLALGGNGIHTFSNQKLDWSSDVNGNSGSVAVGYNQWCRIDMYVRLGTIGQSNGVHEARCVGIGYQIDSSALNRTTSFQKDAIYSGGYVANVQGSHEIYLDDIYIDNTRARVEIGNSSSYASCTQLEMQIPTDWQSDGTAVSFEVNTGSFGTGQNVYVFVITDNGVTYSSTQSYEIGEVIIVDEAPAAPVGVGTSTAGGDNEVVVSWTGNSEPDISHYFVYFSLDGVNYGTAHASQIDHPTVEFTHDGLDAEVTYYYKVRAYDVGGNGSAFSDVVSDEPTGTPPPSGSITMPDSLRLSPLLELDLPVYGTQSQAEETDFTGLYDNIADTLDVQIIPQEYMHKAAYVGYVDSVREYNPDFIALNYVWAFGTRPSNDGGSPFYQGLYDMGVNNSDGYGTGEIDMWLYLTNGEHAVSPNGVGVDDDVWLWNPAFPGLADTLAHYYVDRLKQQTNLTSHVGFFVDWLYSTGYPTWPFGGAGIPDPAALRDSMDMDEDGWAYANDSGVEWELYNDYVGGFASAMRRAANRDDFLVVVNGNAGYRADSGLDCIGTFDGVNYEDFQLYYPQTRNKLINLLVTTPAALNNSRVNPPLIFWQTHRDSLGMTAEALASIGNGVSLYTNAASTRVMPDRLLPTFGTRVPGSVVVEDAETPSDITVSAKFYDGADTTYIWATKEPALETLPYPYLITKGANEAAADTLSYGSEGIRAE